MSDARHCADVLLLIRNRERKVLSQIETSEKLTY